MLDPQTTLFIGLFAGGMMGYSVGFLLARALYRSPTWPR